jgi:hypothetical protein
LLSLVEIDLSNMSLLSQATGQTGEVRCLRCAKHFLASTDFVTSLSIDSFRFVLESFFGDFDADRVLSARCHKPTPRG